MARQDWLPLCRVCSLSSQADKLYLLSTCSLWSCLWFSWWEKQALPWRMVYFCLTECYSIPRLWVEGNQIIGRLWLNWKSLPKSYASWSATWEQKRSVAFCWSEGEASRVKNHCQVGGITKFKGATKGWRNNYWVKGHNQGGRIKGNMDVRGTKPQELSVERWGPHRAVSRASRPVSGHPYPNQTPESPSFQQWGVLQWFSNSWELCFQLQLFSQTHTLDNHFYPLHLLNPPCFSSLEAAT